MQSTLTNLLSMGFTPEDVNTLMDMASQFFASAPSTNAYASGWAPPVRGFVPSEIGFGKPLLPGTGDALAGGASRFQEPSNMPQFIPGLQGGVTGLSNANPYNGGVPTGSPGTQYFPGNIGMGPVNDPRSAIATGIGPTHDYGGQSVGQSSEQASTIPYTPVNNGQDPSVYGGSPFGMQGQKPLWGPNQYGGGMAGVMDGGSDLLSGWGLGGGNSIPYGSY